MGDFVEHTVKYVVSAGWARIGTFTGIYVDIAFQYYVEHKIAASRRIPRPANDKDPTEHDEREGDYEVSALKAVVFAGLAIEAAIYEVAAEHLTDGFVKDHLERIDVFTKWTLVPRLICGKSLDRGGPAMNALWELIQVRNLLVHHKSKPFPPLGGEYDDDAGCLVNYDMEAMQTFRALTAKVTAEGERIVKCAETGIQAIVCLALELEELLGVSIPALGHYSAAYKRLREPDEPIRSLIHECRKKVADRKVKARRTSA